MVRRLDGVFTGRTLLAQTSDTSFVVRLFNTQQSTYLFHAFDSRCKVALFSVSGNIPYMITMTGLPLF